MKKQNKHQRPNSNIGSRTRNDSSVKLEINTSFTIEHSQSHPMFEVELKERNPRQIIIDVFQKVFNGQFVAVSNKKRNNQGEKLFKDPTSYFDTYSFSLPENATNEQKHQFCHLLDLEFRRKSIRNNAQIVQ